MNPRNMIPRCDVSVVTYHTPITSDLSIEGTGFNPTFKRFHGGVPDTSLCYNTMTLHTLPSRTGRVRKAVTRLQASWCRETKGNGLVLAKNSWRKKFDQFGEISELFENCDS